MRGYSNMPHLAWNDGHAVARARLQIQRLEPFILDMPDDMDLHLDGEALHCREITDDGVLVSCDVEAGLNTLADRNQAPRLKEIAAEIDRFHMTIDVDADRHRIIVHD
ncbi:MAG: hypothetical protein HUJ28_05015 [Chromatiales bacterium]|nr:hypothetical protein [Chromatiales bacterium]